MTITNEPTEAQVEAAAKAMHARDLAKSEELYPNRPSMWAKLRPAYYEHARAALVAAQEAATRPAAERIDLARHYWRSQGYDYDLHGLDGNSDYEMGLAVADAALAALAAAQGAAPQDPERIMLHHPDGTPKSNEEIRAKAAAMREGAALQAGDDFPTPGKHDLELRIALGKAREHFTAIANSGEIQVWEDTGEKRGIDHQAKIWAQRGERICREALAAPALPSSGVDVAKIERLIMGRTATAGARAVAAWLKDGA